MKILFVNHWAMRTGAPIVLLHFLRWLKKEKPTIQFDVLSLKTGDLIDEFTAVSDQHFYSHRTESFLDKTIVVVKKKIFNSSNQHLGYSKRKLDAIAKNNYDLIYANTVVSLAAASYLKVISSNTPKLLAHIHELNLTINQYCSNLKVYENSIDRVVAVSKKVKENLLTNWQFETGLVKVVYECSTVPKTHSKTNRHFTVGASGLVTWRKGVDFFLLVAAYVSKTLPEATIEFQWVGKISKLNRLIYEGDIDKLGLNDKVEFIGQEDNPFNSYANMDVFLMTSKEDPFPLVCIEVGMLGKPIICFEGATGTEEVLKQVKGMVVPYLDIEKMGEAVIRYYKNDKLREDHGKQVKQIFKDFTPEKQSQKLWDIIKDCSNF